MSNIIENRIKNSHLEIDGKSYDCNFGSIENRNVAAQKDALNVFLNPC